MLTPECVRLLEEFFDEFGDNAEAVRKDPDLCLHVLLNELRVKKKYVRTILEEICPSSNFEESVRMLHEETETDEEVPQHMRSGK